MEIIQCFQCSVDIDVTFPAQLAEHNCILLKG